MDGIQPGSFTSIINLKAVQAGNLMPNRRFGCAIFHACLLVKIH